MHMQLYLENLQHARTLDSIPSSLSVLPDPGNMGVAVGISLLSCIRAEIYIISYVLPVNGRHLDLWHTYTSNSIIILYCVFYGTKNVLLPLKLCCYHVY